MSVSKISCTLELKGKGSTELALYRHLAPVTVSEVARALPIIGRVALYPRMVCVLTSIRVGVEKQKFEFAKGDVAFMAAGGMVCCMLGPTKSDRPLNPLGKLEGESGFLEKAVPGDTLTIGLVQDAAAQT